MKRPEIDLLPWEWESDREKPREPIFGDGAVSLLTDMLCLAAALCVLFLMGGALEAFGRATSGSAPRTKPHLAVPHLQPGESAVINGITIKRIN